MIVPFGEQLVDNYQVIELPDDGSNTATSSAQHLVDLLELSFWKHSWQKWKIMIRSPMIIRV